MKKTMNNKLKIKIIIDILMLITYIYLMINHKFNLLSHEITGLFIIGICAVHLRLNKQFIKAMLNKTIKDKKTITLNACLFITMTLTIISGILISQELFLFEVFQDSRTLNFIHSLAAKLTFILILVHLFQCKRRLITGIKKLVK